MQALVLQPAAWSSFAPCRILHGMAGPYFREWRKKRGLTLEKLAERLASLEDPLIPQSVGSLSRVEKGQQPYNQRIVEALSYIYQCEPEELIGVNPQHRDELDELMSRLRGKSEFERARIARLINAIDAAEIPEERKSDVA